MRVLTNSLAATDAAIVHIGYSEAIASASSRLGVDIYELRPDPGDQQAKLSTI